MFSEEEEGGLVIVCIAHLDQLCAQPQKCCWVIYMFDNVLEQTMSNRFSFWTGTLVDCMAESEHCEAWIGSSMV